MHATPDEIKSAYKKLAMKYHPDRNQGSRFHEEHFKKVLEAYQTLSDKDKRNLYDLRNFYDAYKSRNTGSTSTAGKQSGEPARAYGTTNEYTRAYQRRTYQPPVDPFAKRPATPPAPPSPVWYRRAHVIVILFWSLASIGMLWYWVYYTMEHRNAVRAFEAGDYEMALRYDEYFGEAWEAYGDKLMEAKVYDKAVISYKAAEKYLPSITWQLLAKRAFCYENTEDPDLAIIDLKDARKMAPDKDSLAMRLGEIFVFDIKQPTLARDYLDSLLLKRDLKPEVGYRAWYAAGMGDFQDAIFSGAISKLSRAAEYPMVSAELYFYRGLAHSRNGDYISGCTDWTKSKSMGLGIAAEYYDQQHCAFILQQAELDKMVKAGKQ